MMVNILIVAVLFSILPCSGSGSIFDILDEQYITHISELPFSSGIPTVSWQQSGNIRGYVDIVGFRNLSRDGEKYFILGDPASLAIVAGEAKANPPGVLDSLDKSISVSQSGTNLIASLNVVLKWHTIACDKQGCYVNGRFTETATFQDIENIPVILSISNEDVQVIYRERNFTIIISTDLIININNSIFDRYTFTNVNGSFEKITRLWKVGKTEKGVYFANASNVNIFHSNNISHSRDLISISDLNFTVSASGLYQSITKVNITRINETSDPAGQFTSPDILGFLSVLSSFYIFTIYIKRRF